MKNTSIVFPVEGHPGWTVTLKYEEGESSPIIEGKDDKGDPLPSDVLDKMRLTLKPGDEE